MSFFTFEPRVANEKVAKAELVQRVPESIACESHAEGVGRWDGMAVEEHVLSPNNNTGRKEREAY